MLQREAGLTNKLVFQRQALLTASQVQQLQCHSVLHGHQGCVNRLAWNESGDKLLSGSDDQQIIVWPYPDTGAPPLVVETQHRAIIFGVQFLPQSNNARLISGGMDHSVQLHELPPADLGSAYAMQGGSPAGRGATDDPGPRRMRAVHQRTTVYNCHRARVKDVEVEPMNPNNFWSAGEDGYVRQYDRRTSTSLQNSFHSANALLAVASKSSGNLEVKSLDICKSRPHLIAVACEDPFVRVYDRRMLHLASPSSNQPNSIGQPVLSLAPAHLAKRGDTTTRMGASHTTYVNFSNRGDRLVTSYHEDHAYCFDVTSSGCVSACYPVNVDSYVPDKARCQASSYAPSRVCQTLRQYLMSDASEPGLHNSEGVGRFQTLPPAAEAAGAAGSQAMSDRRWSEAVDYLSRSIHLAPWAPGLRMKRSEALINRQWPSDALWALHDADTALTLISSQQACSLLENSRPRNANNVKNVYLWKPHFLRAQALHLLQQLQTAIGALLALETACTEAGRLPEVQELWHKVLEAKEQLFKQETERNTSQAATTAQRDSNNNTSRYAEEPEAVSSWTQHEEVDDQEDGSSGCDSDHEGDDSDNDNSDAGGSRTYSARSGSPGATVVKERFSDYLQHAKRHRPYNDGIDTVHTSNMTAVSDGYCGACESLPEYDSTDAVVQQQKDEALLQAIRDSMYANANTTETGSSSSKNKRRRRRKRDAMDQEDDNADPTWGAQHLCDYMPGGRRLLQRYVGHSNIQTDIKESCFLGPSDQLVACGSDDGRVMIYLADTGKVVAALEADEDVANCVQAHPYEAVLATSGIESTISLWGVGGSRSHDPIARRRLTRYMASELDKIVSDNQGRGTEGRQFMRGSVFTTLADHPHLLQLLVGQLQARMGRGGMGDMSQGNEEEEDEETDARGDVACRVN